jgi:TRAP-type C4-dicarboxylate transport system permease small subunit
MIYRILDKTGNAFSKVSMAVLVFVGLFTLANIFLRSVFNAPISGAVEVVQVGMLIANALVLGRAGLLDRHIAVTQAVDWLPKRLGSVFRTLTNLIGLVIFGYVTWHYFISVPAMAATHRVTDVLKVPIYVIYVIMAVCFLLATIMFAYWTVTHFARIIKPAQDAPKKEGIDAIDARDMLT